MVIQNKEVLNSNGDVGKTRLSDIDKAKGLAIFLVVVGHIARYSWLNDIEWYYWLKSVIYMFHMPFFIFLSGVVFFYTYKPINTLNDYRVYITKKAKRLIPGFIIIGLIILLGKIMASQFLFIDNMPSNIIKGFTDILITPARSTACALWYIYILFGFYLTFPIIMIISKRMNLVIIPLAIIHFIPFFVSVTDYFGLNLFAEYAVFFSTGYYFVLYYKTIDAFIEKYKLFFIFLFIFSFSSLLMFHNYIAKTITSLFAIPALYGLVKMKIPFFDSAVTVLGGYTLTIYLFNTIFIGLAKGIFIHFLPMNGIYFMICFPLMVLLGLIGPIILYKYLLSKNSFLKSVMR